MASKGLPSTKAERPRTIGSYRLTSVLASRELLATYHAEHISLARKALVRAAAPNVAASERAKRRIAAEAALLARAAGEGVALLYEVAPDGSYLALEDPGGPSLAEVVSGTDEVEVSRGAAIALVQAMARSLATVHASGLVHGGVEPSAFFLARGRGLVLAGFDRAQDATGRADDADEPERGATSHAYASPEELMGERVTMASDVFSLAVVAHQVLAGVHPFASPSAESLDDERPHGDVAHRIRTERPRPMPPTRGIPIDLERLVERALGKLPGHRPASAIDFAEELRTIRVPDDADSELQRLLIRKGVADAKPGKPPIDAGRDEPAAGSVRGVALRLSGLLGAMVVAGVAFQIALHGDSDGEKNMSSNAPGYVRVLAHPWAEVWIDGANVDTTPIGRPIPLSGGRHTFVFKHPRAEDEHRSVDVKPGATSTLDVTLRVERPPPDAGVDASP